jgi:hypothetical protein
MNRVRVQVFNPPCGWEGCAHHYPSSWRVNCKDRGVDCICPSWFDGGGCHLLEINPMCQAHYVTMEDK